MTEINSRVEHDHYHAFTLSQYGDSVAYGAYNVGTSDADWTANGMPTNRPTPAQRIASASGGKIVVVNDYSKSGTTPRDALTKTDGSAGLPVGRNFAANLPYDTSSHILIRFGHNAQARPSKTLLFVDVRYNVFFDQGNSIADGAHPNVAYHTAINNYVAATIVSRFGL